MFLNTLLLPDTITAWQGGPRFATQVIPSPSGDEARRATWPKELSAWTLDAHDFDGPEMEALIAAFLLTAGRAHSFRFHDQDDDTGTDEVLGAGDGVTTTFPLVKYYPEDVLLYLRPITRPVSGTVTVALDGIPTTAFTVIQGLGLLMLDTAPATDVLVTASFQFHVPVRFDFDAMEVSAMDSLASTWSAIRLVELREAA